MGFLKIILGILVLALSCSIIVAKNESEKSENESSINKVVKLNSSEIYMEGSSPKLEVEIAEEPKKSKVKGRKGVSFEDMKSSSDEQHPAANSTTSELATVQSNSSTTSSFSNVTKISSTSSSPVQSKTNETLNIPSTNSSTSTVKPVTLSSSTTTTTTVVPVRKPLITYSADDSEAIKESEKNINYNVAKEKSTDDIIPKIEQDVDRAMLEEKKTRKSYIIYLFLAVVVPLTFLAINLAYKRVKNYVELRHYQRVDFLIDGMYAN